MKRETRRSTSRSTARLQDEVARLTALVEEMKGRLERLEGGTPDIDTGNGNARSRRDLLKLAGAAAVGAAGAIVLRGVPAAAATNDPILMGQTNTTGVTTNIVPGPPPIGTPNPPSPILQALGQGVTPPTVPSNAMNQSIPLIGAIGPGGILPPVGTSAADYPGFAPIQGVGGVATIMVNGVSKTVSEGINGYGKGNTGVGVSGESDFGYGVIGGSGGIDLAALGNGRVLQLTLPDSLLTSPPSGPPNFKPNDFEQVRDGNGVVWVSQPAPNGSPPAAYWRRLNSMIPMTPVRVVDTRSGLGGVSGMQPAGSTQTWMLAGGNGIPTNAVGLVGNLTAAAYSTAGYLGIFPGGTAWPGNSTVNFSPASYAWANAFIVLFGTGGNVSVYMGATSHVIIDATGFLQ